jgi:hypothetical protein
MYLHVSNKDSLQYFPQNEAAIFRVKLKNTLNLNGAWKIGICSIDIYNMDVKSNKAAGVVGVYITCSACTGLIVDGEQTRVLRCIKLERNVHVTYSDVFYVPLDVCFLDTIEFSVVRDTSTLVLFGKPSSGSSEDGKSSDDSDGTDNDDHIGSVSMTLHLKRL